MFLAFSFHAMIMGAASVFLLVLAALTGASASNILAVVPLPARSHIKLFEPIVEELAKRGHHVTYVTPFGFKPPIKNVEEIIIPMFKKKAGIGPPNFFDMRHDTLLHNIVYLPQFTNDIFNQTMGTEEFQSIYKNGRQYDVIIMESMLTEAMAAGLAYKLKAPFIGYATIMPSYWTSFWVGNESPTSYIPDPFTSLPYKMTFTERLLNGLFSVVANTYHHTAYMKSQDEMMRFHFGNDLPPIQEIIANASLLFVNDHYSLSFPRPVVPNLVSIGGIHLEPPKELPADLKKYLDESKHGAILFSLGSNLKSSDMGEDKIQLFLNVFAKLKQNVLWKFEVDLPNKPSNVLTSNWLPQSDILAHPNLKLFITHGGLLSTIESVDRGVPVIGIPIFGDQPMNMRQSVNAGVGLSLDYDLLTEKAVLDAILEILQNPKYTEAAKTRSKSLKDVPASPKETAMWWIEYVIRHRGAPHLRSAAQDLTWYQRQQLDVLAAILAIASAALYITIRVICAISSKLCNKKPTINQIKKKK